MGVKHRLRNAVNRLLAAGDAELVRRSEHHREVEALNLLHGPQRFSPRSALEHARNLGFSPATVVDVGAGTGTPELFEVFPAAHHIFIEPLEEYRQDLETIARSLNRAAVVIAAATQVSGDISFNVHPDFYGSSIYLEDEASDVNGVPRTVPGHTLDEICRENACSGPYLLKMDVQGAELDVLAGAEAVLKQSEYIMLETTLFKFFRGGPQFKDVIARMEELGFAVYDLFEPKYRPIDGALSQVDFAFVKEAGMFRRQHSYANPEQRHKQTEAIRKYLKESGKLRGSVL